MIRRVLTAVFACTVLLGCGTEPPMAPDAEVVDDGPPAGAEVTRSTMGSFVGIAGHVARGDATFEIKGDFGVVTLHENFTSTPVPDPYLYMGVRNDANAGGSIRVARLKFPEGHQTYTFRLPTDAPRYDYVIVWCDAFNVGVGAAAIP